MSTPARPLHRYTYADYLALEKDSPIKHEFLAGEIYARAGGTPEHAALAAAVTALLAPSSSESRASCSARICASEWLRPGWPPIPT